ncbi:MAG TPA: hypothetical protein VGP82_14295 [Ktedonobacterales bacterium]|nr:hypothetical protein [Ktedonobacterales bacterium]
MSREDIAVSPANTSQAGSEASSSETHLHGRRLVAARILVGTTMAVVAVLFILALPGGIDRLVTPCDNPVDQCLIRPEQVAPLAHLGVTPGALAIIAVLISCLIILLVDVIAAVLLWRRSDDWMALLVALVFALMPVNFTPVLAVLRARPEVLQIPAAALAEASTISLFLLVALFPSGRFVPRWLWLPFLLLQIFFSPLGDVPLPGPNLEIPEVFGFVLILGLLLCFVIGQIYRYRRVSTPLQRQQTKWVIYGIILLIVLNQLFWQTYLQVPAFQEKDSLYGLLAYPDDFLVLAILVITLCVSILRYRLWDIDVIINQTLVYGSLTAILATVYAVGVIGSQTVVGGLTHSSGQEQSPLIIVVTTLVIAALFQPLRRRIQALIDRRFYRRKYDAEQTLAAFSTALRQEVDLGPLQDRLTAVVQETMQPAHISLWLLDGGASKRAGGA